ncbi:MAG: hypothetical protein KR126chlam5_00275 [Candidatus Anoxychlamydiales bacterium]|nr:hypothetical protein [Candidatus Anoxychlamydiales bacterium]
MSAIINSLRSLSEYCFKPFSNKSKIEFTLPSEDLAKLGAPSNTDAFRQEVLEYLKNGSTPVPAMDIKDLVEIFFK